MASTRVQRGVAAGRVAAAGALLIVSTALDAHTIGASWSAPSASGGEGSTTLARVITDSGLVHATADGIPFTFQAMAAADLRTGRLRTLAYADTVDSGLPAVPPQLPAGGHVEGTRIVQAHATFEDSLTFAAPAGAAAAGPVPVTIRLAVDGRFAGFYSHFHSKTLLMSGGGGSLVKSASTEYTWDGNQGPQASPIAIAVATTLQGPFRDPADLHDLLSFTKLVTPGVSMYVYADMTSTITAGPYASGMIDFSHTATLSIEAPAGYTFTSESGMLLAVPEPRTHLLMALGLALVLLRAARRRAPAAALAACAFGFSSAASAAVGVDYTLDAIVNDFTAAPVVTQSRDLKTGHLSTAGFGTASASRLDADGFTIGNTSFDPAIGKVGFLAHTLSGTMNKGYLLNATNTYRDAVSVVTAAAQPVATQVVLNMTVEGDFGGSANQGAVTMTFSAAGQSTFLQLSRGSAPLNPGFDFYRTWNDFRLAPVSVLVPAGTTQHFIETLSLTVPLTALPSASQAIFTGLPSVGGSAQISGRCSATNPCAVMAHRLSGTVAPAPEFQFEVALSSSSGNGAQLGESLLDLTHTATLGVQTPTGVSFLLWSGALAGDPHSAFTVLPVIAVPEPSAAVFLLAGLGVLLARRRPDTVRRTATDPAKEAR